MTMTPKSACAYRLLILRISSWLHISDPENLRVDPFYDSLPMTSKLFQGLSRSCAISWGRLRGVKPGK